jgi:hypothetical protein
MINGKWRIKEWATDNAGTTDEHGFKLSIFRVNPCLSVVFNKICISTFNSRSARWRGEVKSAML